MYNHLYSFCFHSQFDDLRQLISQSIFIDASLQESLFFKLIHMEKETYVNGSSKPLVNYRLIFTVHVKAA